MFVNKVMMQQGNPEKENSKGDKKCQFNNRLK
jgi:hypothetical protein